MINLRSLLSDPILCHRCIHAMTDEFTGKQSCRMEMVKKKLERKRCSEFIDKTELVENHRSECIDMSFGKVYMLIRRGRVDPEKFYDQYCKKCKLMTKHGWCKRFARRTDELAK